MENLYEILESSAESSRDTLKRSYQKLALKYHPDKHLEVGDGNNKVHEMFVKINQAWKILGDDELRKEYDIRWKQRSIMQDWPVQEYVDLSDFDENEDNTYSLQCRCGGLYTLNKTDLQLQTDIVCCDTCTLTIVLKYEENL